jgi:4-hydroxybenzoate polyprenyltransferase
MYIFLCVVEARPVVQLVFLLRFLAGFALAGHHLPVGQWYRLPVAALTWTLAVAAVYLLDGVTDVAEDRFNGSVRPIARGALPRPVATAVCLCWAALAMSGAVVLGGGYLVLVPALLVSGYLYATPPVRLKNSTGGAGLTLLTGGLLTFLAGAAVPGLRYPSVPVVLFAIVMSLWMGAVGALAKDLSDAYGDGLVGRRTRAVVRGIGPAAARLSVHALAIGAGFLVAAVLVARVLVVPAVVLLAGAATVSFACHRSRADGRWRRPYRMFMITQYFVHVLLLAEAVVLPI